MDLASAFGISENTLLAFVIILVLVLIGFLTFNLSLFVKGDDGLSFGSTVAGQFGGNREQYIVLGKEDYLSKAYPKGNSRGPYMSEGFSQSLWDTGSGQMSTPGGQWSTITGYDESMRGVDMPSLS